MKIHRVIIHKGEAARRLQWHHANENYPLLPHMPVRAALERIECSVSELFDLFDERERT